MATKRHADLPDETSRIDELFGTGTQKRRWPGRLAGAVVAFAVISSLAGVAAARAGSDPASSYRTSTAKVADVAANWTGVAGIEPVSQAAVAFPASGTVASVDVQVGDAVEVGSTLATLDTTSLQRTLHQRQSALDEAALNLSDALIDAANSESTTTTTVVSSGSSAGPSTDAANTPGGGSDLGAAQQSVLSSQKAVDAALGESATALAVVDRVCASGGDDASSSPLPAASTAVAESSTVPGKVATPPAGFGSTSDAASACRGALQDVSAAQQSVASAQARLADDMSRLNTLLTTRSTAGDSTGAGSLRGTNGGGTSGGDDGGAGSANSPGAPANGSSTPSAEDLIAYQRAVDAAELQVAVATQAVAQATIVSPINGTVVAVGIAAGEDVSAASSTQTITIQGDGGYEATAVVSLSDISGITMGAEAALVPDGSHEVIKGEVVAVAVTPTTSTSGAGFRVTIGFANSSSDALRNGATGSLSISTGAAVEALTVPTSAVTTTDGRSTVKVLEADGKTSDVNVEVGVVGLERTEITRGVSAGDVVVLADLNTPLPSSATDGTSNGSSNGRFNGGGNGGISGFSGGGNGGFQGPPGGFGGGRPGG